MNRGDLIRELLEDYKRQRAANEDALAARIALACEMQPDIGRLRRESASLALDTMRGMLKMTTQEERVAAAQAMRDRGQAINREIRFLLKQANLPENHLELQYRCDVCRDTGYVGEAPSRFCDCFENRLRLMQHEDGSMVGVEEQNFETFNESFIPEADGQRRQTVLLRQMCEEYADRFPETGYKNIVLTGEGGLGKTFLLNSIFERVISRGHSAVRITAFRMFEAMRQQHIGSDPAFDGFSSLVDAPLLLIDDLGTEPMMRNITVEYLFMLLNERAARKLHTVIATNLTPVQMQERYGERVASRLLDRMNGRVVQLKGKDLRKL